jgi:lycopene cyclase domain-containing protein
VTYFRFHWIFNAPLLIILILLDWRDPWRFGAVQAMQWVLLAVVVFTTPWDNIAVRRGIWGFPRDKYTFRLGWLPVEEYLFFVLQTLNVIYGVRLLFHLHPEWHRTASTVPTTWTALCLAASALTWIVIGLQVRQWGRRKGSRVNYMLHLAWFLPVIYVQWILAPNLFGAHAGLLALVTLAFGLYYTIADYIAVRAELWFFDEKQITGWKLAGVLPWEEIAFFGLTSLLVAQSYLLLLPYYQR